jgi:hypothetical protein
MVSWDRRCAVLPVEGVLCDSVGGVYPIEVGFDWLVIGVCMVGKYFMVGVGMSSCIIESPLMVFISNGGNCIRIIKVQ